MILCCGNPDRADDAAGLLVARRLQALGIEAHEHTRDALALLDAWRGADDVILVDAVVTGAPTGTVSVWDGGAPLPADVRFGCSTHAIGVAEAVGLARSLGCLPERLLLYGIEAQDFTPGAAPSGSVLEAVEDVAQRIRAYPVSSAPNSCMLF